MSMPTASLPPPTMTPRRSRRWIKVVAVLVGLVALIVTLRLTILRPAALRVEVALVQRGVVEDTVTNTRAGTLKARHRARLSPETAGRVVALPFRKGTRVAAGAVILRLDSEVQRAQVALAHENVKAADARVDEACLGARLAESEHLRGLELRAGGIASEQAMERLKSESERAAATCRAARATLDQAAASARLAQAELSKTELRAPFAGVVSEVATELGEWITPSPPGVPIPPVVEMLDPRSIYVTAPIDEMDAERVHAGQEVRLSVDSRRGVHFAGRLVRVAPYVQDVLEQNRTVEVEAEFLDAALAGSLLPGTSADVEVILERRQDVLQVPTGAIAQGGMVLLVDGDRLALRSIQTGLRNWKTTEIKGGLAEGERVVTVRDSPEIRAGARVTTGNAR